MLRTPETALPVWTIHPTWKGGILERLEWLTDVIKNDYGCEQRRAMRLSPRRSFEADFALFDQERAFLDLWLHRLGSQEFMLPLWHDNARLNAAVASGAIVIPVDTADREFVVGGLALLCRDDGDAFNWNRVTVSAIAPDSVTVAAGEVTQAWAAGSTLYPLRRARLTDESELKMKSSRVGLGSIEFELVQANDLADEGTWSTIFAGYPLLTTESNWSEDIEHKFNRNRDELDNKQGLVRMVDAAGRAFTTQKHSFLMRGRAELAAYRRFVYRLRGQQKTIWIPTGNRDIELSRPRVAADGILDIKKVGYGYTGGAVSGRNYLLLNGSIPLQISGTTGAPSAGEERLTIVGAVGSNLLAGVTGSFLDTCRLNDDTVEIQHHADSDGAAESTLAFRSFRDERTTDGPLEVAIPASVMSAVRCGVPASEEAVCLEEDHSAWWMQARLVWGQRKFGGADELTTFPPEVPALVWRISQSGVQVAGGSNTTASVTHPDGAVTRQDITVLQWNRADYPADFTRGPRLDIYLQAQIGYNPAEQPYVARIDVRRWDTNEWTTAAGLTGNIGGVQGSIQLQGVFPAEVAFFV